MFLKANQQDQLLQVQKVNKVIKKKSEKGSNCWNFFEIVVDSQDGKQYTQCKVEGCKIRLAYSKQTSSMNKHLIKVHSIKLKAKEEEEKNESKEDQKHLSQSKIDSNAFKFNSLTKERETQITMSLAQFVAVDMRSIHTIEGKGFKNFIETIEPRYKIPTRKTISEKFIPKIYDESVKLLTDQVKEVSNYALAFDYWTSCASKAYLECFGEFHSNPETFLYGFKKQEENKENL